MVNSHLGYRALTDRNTSFSNINKAKPVWWFTIKPNKFRSDLHLLLAKDNDAGLIWLKIKANTFPDLENVFRIRHDKHYYGCIDFEIPISGPSYMRDIKGGGSGYDFKPHIQREWNESEDRSMSKKTTKATVTITRPGHPRPPLVDLSQVSKDGPLFEGTDVPVQYLYEYLDHVHNLYAFLNDFPEVTAEQALKAIRERINATTVISSDRGYVSGMPRFKGTRMPVRILFDYLAQGYTIEGFLDSFATGVTREQAVKALETAREALESMAYEAAALPPKSDARKIRHHPIASRSTTSTPKPELRTPPIKRRDTPPSPPPLIGSRP